jgi:hypothetical protein
MAKRTMFRGKTSATISVFIRNSSTGAPLTGLVFNTSGLVCSYATDQVARAAVTLATLAAADSAWSSGGFKEIDATNMPGVYRFDIPNAALAAGEGVSFAFTGASSLCNFEIDLWAVNPQNATRMGMTAFPDVATGNAGAVITSGTGTAQISLSSGGVALSTSGLNAAADAVWDEAASGHVAAGSYGQALNIIRAGTAQAGAGTTITLDASASAVDDFYNNQKIFITAGTGVGQGRIISDYVGSTKVATVPTWATNPSSDSVFVIMPFGSIPGASAPTAGEVADAVWDELRADHLVSGSFGQVGALVLRSATAQAGTSSTITLDASASATNDIYNYNQITVIAGTGVGQSRQVTDYVGSSKVATVGVAWTTNPSSDSVFLITPLGVDAATLAAIADSVWDEARSGHATAGTFGEYVNADTIRLSGDATAADNAESFFDGTGYAGTNNVIPSVTTVTGNVAGSVASVTGLTASDVGAIKTKTDFLPSATAGAAGGVFIAGANAATSITTALTANITGDVTGNLSGSAGSVTGAVGSVTGNVGGNVVGSVGSVTTVGDKTGYSLSAAGVDAILDEAITEPAGVFSWASATPRNIIGYVGAKASNRITQTATTQTLRDRANTVNISTAAVTSDGTTTVKGSDT